MKRLIATAGACLLFPTVAAAQTSEPRRIAPVLYLSGAGLFETDGTPSKRAARNVRDLRNSIEPLLGDAFAETPFALAITGELCDELHLATQPDADRVIDALRTLGRDRPVLAATYGSARIDPISPKGIGESLREHATASAPCTGAPNSGFVPPQLILPGEEGLEALSNAGVRRALAGSAVEQADKTPNIVPAMKMEAHQRSAEVLRTRPEARGLAVVIRAAEQLEELAADERLELTSVEGLGEVDIRQGFIAPEVHVSGRAQRAVEEGVEAYDRLKAVTLPGNRLLAIFRTQLARVESTAQGSGKTLGAWAPAEDLERAIRAQLGLWSVSDGSVTFTSRRGSIPVTVSNDATYPVRIRVTASSPKLDFPSGRTRVVTIEPPGRTITFDSIAKSTGTFPVTVSLRTPDRRVTFDDAALIVRSTGANLPALVLTAGGALFLMVWIARRVRRGRAP